MKIALGTAQFGMNYGINNKRGKIPKEEVFKILKNAIDSNIEIIDTAFDYGESEKVIGDFGEKNKLKIITKGDVNNFEQSLENLKVDKVYGYLIHHFEDFKVDRKIWEKIKEKKKNGKVEKIGFSFYNPKEIEYILKNDINPDIVQIPYNIFDRRFEYLIEELKKMNVEIYARSIFLQGLVFKKEFDGVFLKIKDKVELLNTISKTTGVPISAICINFVLLNRDIDFVVLGVDGIQNFEENVKSVKYKNEIRKKFEKLKELREEDERLINPSKW